MESYLDKFIRKYVRKVNPMWYLYYCWRNNYSDKRLDDFGYGEEYITPISMK